MLAPIVIAAFQFLALALVFPQLPFQAMALGADPAVVALLLAADTVTAVFLAPLFGRLSDHVGRKTIILVGLAVAPVAYAVLANAASLEMLFVSRLMSGAGLATVSVAQAYIADRSVANSRLAGLAGMNGAYGLAFVVGPLVASMLFLGDSGAYSLTAYCALACTVLSFAVAALVLAPNAPAPKAAVGSADEAYGRKTRERPSRDHGISVLLVVSGIIIFAYAAMTATVGVWSKAALGWGPRELSLAFAVTGGTSVLAQVIVASRLRAYVEDVTVVWLAGLGMGVGLVALATLPDQVGTVAIMALIGFSTAVAITCVQYLILSHAPVRTIGKVAGFGQSVVGIARIFGPAAGGLCLTYLGISSPFFLGAGLAGAAVIALLRFRQTIRMRYSTP